MTDDLTQRGIAAFKKGNRDAARQLLLSAIKQDPNDVLAWLWLSGAVGSDNERLVILRHILEIDPGNQAAMRGINKIQPKSETEQSAPVQPQTSEEAIVTAPPAELSQSEAARLEILRGSPPGPALSAEPAGSTTTESFSLPTAMGRFRPASRRRKKEITQDYERSIFRTRPSLVQTLLFFWAFFFGTLGINYILRRTPGITNEGTFISTTVIGLVLELLVLYVAIRRFRTRYELSTQVLSLPFRGQRILVPISDIHEAKCRQSILQRILTTGDIWISAEVTGELVHLRLRDVPYCQQRTKQIIELLR